MSANTDRFEKPVDHLSLCCTAVERLWNPAITAGNQLYVIGAQDGSFPRHGWHIPGDMGGVWAHPIKLADGFALAIDGAWVPAAHTFRSEALCTVLRSDLEDGITIDRTLWVPDDLPGLVIRYDLQSPVDRQITVRLSTAFHFLPVWPVPDGFPSDLLVSALRFDEGLGAWICQRPAEPWCTLVGCRTDTVVRWSTDGSDVPVSLVASDGQWATIEVSAQLQAAQIRTIEFVLSGSSRGWEVAKQSFREISADAEDLFTTKSQRYAVIMSHSRANIPEPSIALAWDWLKANNDWLVRDVPGVGRGLGAGAADFVWWFGCDSAYAVLGCLALGQYDIAIETIELIRDLSERANGGSGQVLHEANTRGQVVHPGLAQETPHLTSATWDVFRWTGDREFLERMYPFCRKGVLEWTIGQHCRPSQNAGSLDDLLPYGYGITEVEGMDLQCIDTAVHTVDALHALAGMAMVLDDPATAAHCNALAPRVQAAIEKNFWMEHEGLYGDMIATPVEMIERLERWLQAAEQLQPGPLYKDLVALLVEARNSPSPTVKRPWFLGHWVVLTPLAAGFTSHDHAIRMLERIEGREFSGPAGMYLDALARTQSMSINTGVLAATEFRYGRPGQGLGYLRQLADTLSLHMPGAISEYLPDEGCFVQAWSGYALAWPLVTFLFGLQPDAHDRHLRIEPCFPMGWQGASLHNVRVGRTTIDLEWDGHGMAVTVREPGWTISSASVPLRVMVG